MYSPDPKRDLIFTEPFERDTMEERIEQLRDRQIKQYRTTTIKSGALLESESYPIWPTKPAGAVNAKQKPSSKAQEALNHRNLQKRVVRLTNANFTSADMWFTGGWRGKDPPESIEVARRDTVNYIRRLQRAAAKRGWAKLKYIYVIECDPANKIRPHIHLIVNFPDRDLAETLWQHGKYPQARRLQPDDYGLEGLARYITKDSAGAKKYGYSLGLYKPWEHSTRSHKLTRGAAEKLATGRKDPKRFFEQRYPGYRFLDMEVRRSEFVSGAYIYARMRRTE